MVKIIVTLLFVLVTIGASAEPLDNGGAQTQWTQDQYYMYSPWGASYQFDIVGYYTLNYQFIYNKTAGSRYPTYVRIGVNGVTYDYHLSH